MHSILVFLYNRNGDIYTGQWNGEREGEGEINYNNGYKFIGGWKSDYDYKNGWFLVRHGLGTVYSSDGQVLSQGKWHYGEFKGNE